MCSMIELLESAVFICRYKQQFGFVIPGRKIIVDDVRIRGIGQTDVHMEHTIPRASDGTVTDMASVHFDCSLIVIHQ